jgi:hypothetical protein
MEFPADKRPRIDYGFVGDVCFGASSEPTAGISTECQWSGLNSINLVCYGMVSETDFAFSWAMNNPDFL